MFFEWLPNKKMLAPISGDATHEFYCRLLYNLATKVFTSETSDSDVDLYRRGNFANYLEEFREEQSFEMLEEGAVPADKHSILRRIEDCGWIRVVKNGIDSQKYHVSLDPEIQALAHHLNERSQAAADRRENENTHHQRIFDKSTRIIQESKTLTNPEIGDKERISTLRNILDDLKNYLNELNQTEQFFQNKTEQLITTTKIQDANNNFVESINILSKEYIPLYFIDRKTIKDNIMLFWRILNRDHRSDKDTEQKIRDSLIQGYREDQEISRNDALDRLKRHGRDMIQTLELIEKTIKDIHRTQRIYLNRLDKKQKAISSLKKETEGTQEKLSQIFALISTCHRAPYSNFVEPHRPFSPHHIQFKASVKREKIKPTILESSAEDMEYIEQQLREQGIENALHCLDIEHYCHTLPWGEKNTLDSDDIPVTEGREFSGFHQIVNACARNSNITIPNFKISQRDGTGTKPGWILEYPNFTITRHHTGT